MLVFSSSLNFKSVRNFCVHSLILRTSYPLDTLRSLKWKGRSSWTHLRPFISQNYLLHVFFVFFLPLFHLFFQEDFPLIISIRREEWVSFYKEHITIISLLLSLSRLSFVIPGLKELRVRWSSCFRKINWELNRSLKRFNLFRFLGLWFLIFRHKLLLRFDLFEMRDFLNRQYFDYFFLRLFFNLLWWLNKLAMIPLAILFFSCFLDNFLAFTMHLAIQPHAIIKISVDPGHLSMACSLVLFEETLEFGTVFPL